MLRLPCYQLGEIRTHLDIMTSRGLLSQQRHWRLRVAWLLDRKPGIGPLTFAMIQSPTKRGRLANFVSNDLRGFCAEEDAGVRVDSAGVCSATEAGILTFNPLNQ